MSKATLFKKIHEVMKDVQYLKKDDKVEFGNTKYSAISEEKVTMTIRESLIKNGLVIIPVKQSHSREGNLSTVDVEYKIVDIDTGEYEIAVSSGTGADTQDKGVGKAMTYSYKYLLLRTFAIPTGEDPDKISSAELDDKEKKEKEKRQREAEKSKTDGPPETLKAKYQSGKGSMDGFEDWVKEQQSKNRNYKQMEEMLAAALLKKGA